MKYFLVILVIIRLVNLFSEDFSSDFEPEMIKFSIERISGNSYFSEYKIFELTGYNERTYFTEKELATFTQNLIDLYIKRNFFFVDIDYKEIESKRFSSAIISLELLIREGPICKFTEFKFRGNNTTKNQTLIKISRVNQFKEINLEKIRYSESLVNNKNYIDNFSIIPIDKSTLLFETSEGKMTKFYGIAGYNNTDKNRNLTGFIDFHLLNIFGTDRTIVFFWRAIEKRRSSVKIEYYETGPMDIPLSGKFSLYREIVEADYKKIEVDSDIFYYTLNSNYGIYIGLEEIFPGTAKQDLISRRRFYNLGLFYTFNNQYNKVNSESGVDFQVRYYKKFYNKNKKNTSKNGFDLNFSHLYRLSGNIVYYNSLNCMFIEKKDLENYELIPLGGFRNLRGFSENRFYGYLNFWSNNELRFLLNPKSRFFLFFDYGYVETLSNDLEVKLNDLVGYGLGLNLKTPIGLMGISYGLSYHQKRFSGLMEGIIHFGLEIKF